ncbi:hypothetical protein FHU10_1036 [Serratia fonticola]|jgi:hypothetical protein|uniref:Uncharacterized protein n=1 Tax=Serratia fonticola TaxID=47917 RepID=A0A542BK18_SERFO|nr:hypothetical protein FHU09_1412 [Serratia fonticola]TQI99059.1 hypothetical protein FHU11_4637 [Serratia fonticola]TVZ68584.1 hypothetical protein FHU10_1036 [Serratia fonticola]
MREGEDYENIAKKNNLNIHSDIKNLRLFSKGVLQIPKNRLKIKTV